MTSDSDMLKIMNGDRIDGSIPYKYKHANNRREELKKIGMAEEDVASHLIYMRIEDILDGFGIRRCNSGGGSLNTYGRVEALVFYATLLEEKLREKLDD